VEGERGLDALTALTKVYFSKGGMVIQGNIFSVDDLQEAQRNPEKYANLQVRVCGWNEYFVKMTPQKQNDFIKRCQSSR
jgi:formate C-acetyltransferase